MFNRCKHNYIEKARYYAQSDYVLDNIARAPVNSLKFIERNLMGVTTVELECSGCGDRKTYEIIGDAT